MARAPAGRVVRRKKGAQRKMKLKSLQMPKKIEIDEGALTDRYGKFVLEPLERGYGTTLGSALRRVLLSSLPGAAITAIRVDGALMEFTTMSGILEDTTELVLNLKKVRLRLHGDGLKRGLFEMKSEGELTAGDLQVDADVEILNPELHIATLNKDADVRIEVEISPGMGYVPADEQGLGERPIGVVPIDALFSPVTKANFSVESARIGQRIDYDKLTLEVWTDGSMKPADAVASAAKILKDHFALFSPPEEEVVEEVEEEPDEEFLKTKTLLEKSVEELELSVRSGNCLKAANIKTLGDLVKKTEAEMLKYRNFGRKSLKEIADILEPMGLKFGMDVDKYFDSDKKKEEEVQPLGAEMNAES
jgi:DNA-directed RNA polymerase subunit alpha